MPVRKALRAIEELTEEAGDVSSFAALPGDPLARLKELGHDIAQVADAVEQAAGDINRAKETIKAFTEKDEQVLVHEAAIRTWTQRASSHETKRVQLEQHRSQALQAQTTLRDHASRLLSVAWNDGLVPPFRDLALADLRHKVRRYDEVFGALEKAKTQAQTIALNTGETKSLLPWLALAGSGLVALAAGIALSLSLATLAGVAALCIGGIQAYNARAHNSRLETRMAQLDVEGLEQQAREAGAEVAKLLQGIPLPEQRAFHPDRDLISDMQALQDAVGRYYTLARELKKASDDVKAEKTEVLSLIQACGLEASPSLAAMVTDLEDWCAAAQQRRQEAQDARTRLADLLEEKEKRTRALEALEEERTAIQDALRSLGNGNEEAGAETLHRRRKATERAADQLEALQQKHPDLDALRAEIAAAEANDEGWTFTDEDIVRIEEELEWVQGALREEDTSRAKAEKELETLQRGRTADIIESEIEHVDAHLAEVKRERDRLALLANIIRHADYNFRMKHQPDVIKLASAHLSTITEGRYERLALEEDSDDLLVYEEGAHFPQRVGEPMSQGTLDQIYLAIRLAIIDHLDQNQETLPLFLDEVFVHWDQGRRARGYDILRGMAEQRQIFLFTCHQGLAAEFARGTGAYHLVL